MKQRNNSYDHLKLEQKWQKEWEKKGVYKTSAATKKPKKYVLDMFPYPSGQGLHVGHPRGYIASDVYARLMRMKGFNVLHPMGFDSFGLPAEQYAIKTGNNPKTFTDQLVKHYRKQLDIIGFSYDWDRQIATHRPEYYKWTQAIFLKLFNAWYDTSKNKAFPIETLVKTFEKSGNTKIEAACDADVGKFSASEWKATNNIEKEKILMKYRLAYEGFSEVNWCPELGTVLANDEIVDGPDGKPVSERGGFPVVKKSLRQWFLRITAYADRLLGGLDDLDWSSHIKEIQKNWIGKSEGSELEFKISDSGETIKVFTTRADTLFGVTYVVLAPEHALVQKLRPKISNWSEVENYIKEAKNKDDITRTAEDKEKTGVELKGVKAVNPANGEEVPVWVADYVLASYGTGAVMAVPAHDERDFAFAEKYKLPIKHVVIPSVVDHVNPPRADKSTKTRNNVHAIVFDPAQKKYLILRNEKHGWDTVVIGGIEEGEKSLDAALRELREETGYVDFEFKRVLGAPVRAAYFAKHKDENRVAYTTALYLELKGDTKVAIDEGGENDGNEILWVSEDHFVPGKMVNSELPYWLERIHAGEEKAYVGGGVLINSDGFDGVDSDKAKSEITQSVHGRMVTKYKMRDAVFARQRYWGEPIPLVHEKDGTIKPLKEKDLPLILPNVKSYAPIGTGESPLAGVKEWVKKGYETNTMPGWAGSSWYFLRYMDPENKSKFASEKALKYWKQVDMYVGGAEHATGHLLYARFWHKFLFDLKLVASSEPFKALRNQGMILGTDNRKMSKRWGNVVNPDDVVKTFGADTLRVFEMFIGPFDSQLPWSTDGIVGSRRFIERVWRLQSKISDNKKAEYAYEQALHKAIKKVGEDIESFSFNTAISAMMICLNEMEASPAVLKSHFESFVKILAPFAPHVTEELWAILGNKGSIHTLPWPKYDVKKLVSEFIKIAVQVNGKVRGVISVPQTLDKEAVLLFAQKDQVIAKWIGGKEIIKSIFVPGRLVNFVVKG